MSHSMTWNGTAFSTYGLIVRLATPAPTLSRTYESKQTQDRAWAGKGQGAPSVFNLPVVIVGTSSSNLLSRVSTVRGLLDQEDECTLAFDMYTDRYWMAKFDSMTGDYTSPTTWEGYIVFTCHDRKAYANAASSQTETLTENISADYGGTVYAIAYDDDYVYIAGGTTNAVQQLSKIDLSLVATGPDYGGTIYCLCCDSTNGYIYYGGDGGAGQYDMCQLLTSDMTTIVRGPDYGGIIYACAQYGNYIYYGGNGGAGEYDIAKLLKSDMTTIVRSADTTGVIYAIVVNATHVFTGGGVDGGGHYHVSRWLITDLSYVDQSDDYAATIYGLALTTDGLYVLACGAADTVWRITIAAMATEVISADLGGDLHAICCDDDYIYVVGVDNVVFKLDIAFTAAASYVAKSGDYGGDVYAIAIDTTNNHLFIGGDTTQTVWKLDSRHLPVSELSSIEFNSTCYAIGIDADYLYVASGNYLYKINKRTGQFITKSPDYGGVILAVETNDDLDVVYIAGATTRRVWMLSKEGLTFLAQSDDYGGSIRALCYYKLTTTWTIHCAGETTKKVWRLSGETLVKDTESADYGGAIIALATYSGCGFIFCGGYITQKVFKLAENTLVKDTESAGVGCSINTLHCTDTYCLCGDVDGYVNKFLLSDLSSDAVSIDFGTTITNIRVWGSYVYVAVINKPYLLKLFLSDLTLYARSESYIQNFYSLATDGGFVYVGIYYSPVTACPILKFDTRVLWQRSDHEITITSAGTASSGLDFASTASQANYWQQAYENQTTGDEFDWEGTQASGEELEVDSELWYCTLEGASAMSGVSGEFLTLSPGANTLYLENVTGVVVFDWTDRFA